MITEIESRKERDKAQVSLVIAKITESKFKQRLTYVKVPKGYILTTNPEKWKGYSLEGNISAL